MQILVSPAATLIKLCSHQVHDFHPGWMLDLTNPGLDPAHREGNGNLWLNPTQTHTWKHSTGTAQGTAARTAAKLSGS